MKKLLLVLICFMFVFSATAADLATVGVVDIVRVAEVHLRDSKDFRDIEDFRLQIEEELRSINKEIDELLEEQLEARQDGNDSKVRKLEEQIYEKKTELRQYYNFRTKQLEDMKKNLTNSDAFIQELNNAIKRAAERRGFTVILRLDESNIIWYSREVDITDQVIDYLTL